MASLEMKRQDEENRRKLGLGEVQAGRALAQGQYVSELAGTAASAAQTGIGIYGMSAANAAAPAAKTAAPGYLPPVTQTPAFYGNTGLSYGGNG